MRAQGNAIVSIKNIVDDLPSTVTWKQVVYEAVTNSIQAGATQIKIKFTSNTMEMENSKKYIDSIIIEDNGEGFTSKNLKAFEEYKTQNKRELGCKGIGRFLYLKVFNKVGQSNLKNKVRIWTYAFLKFDPTTDGYLDDKDYNKIPTHSEYPIYYKYHEKRNTIINFMDYHALSSDAENRHKTFMKILSGDSLRTQDVIV